MSTLRDDELQLIAQAKQLTEDVEELEKNGGRTERLIALLIRGMHRLTDLELSNSRKLDRLLAEDEPSPPTDFIQTQGANMLTGKIKGLLAGATDTFFSTPVDKNGVADALPTGSSIPTNTSDDPAVVFAPAADGLSTAITANPAPTTPDFGWTVSASLPDGTVITSTVRIPNLPAPALAPVGFVQSQGAPAV